MSEKKQTFIDPKTGKEIEISKTVDYLAQIVDCNLALLEVSVLVGVVCGVIYSAFYGISWQSVWFPLVGAGFAVIFGLIYGPLSASKYRGVRMVFKTSLILRDLLARWQHHRRGLDESRTDDRTS